MDDLTLIPFGAKHLPSTVQWMDDPVILAGILKNRIDSQFRLRVWVEDFYKQPNSVNFAIHNRGEHIGNISLRNMNWKENRAEMMIYIGKDRGKGYGKLATKMFLSYCFNVMMIPKIYVTVGEKNLIARRLYKKVGFADRGVFKNIFYQYGKYINVVKMVKKNENIRSTQASERRLSRGLCRWV